MNNPYEILGIPENATDEQIREAYRSLARRIQDDIDNGVAPPYASERMKEIDSAYDSIIMSRTSGYAGSSYQESSQSYNNDNFYQPSDLGDIRDKIRNNRLDDAEILLDGFSSESRTAEWYFLKGTVQYRKGWLEEAAGNFAAACRLDPNNKEYSAAYNNLSKSSSGGYRTESSSEKSGCSACDVCSGLVCADCCCECMGGDLIRCC